VIAVRVHFHGAIDRRGLAQDHSMQLEPGTTVNQLLRSIGYSDREIRFIVPMIAGERAHPQHPLADGDRLDLLAPAGGG
jgi:sulfur carrier protein ThiS